MPKKMLIDATHSEETRVVVVDGNKVEEFDFESESRRQLAGNIYLAKVTRVEPSLQAAFVDYGGNRHGFLAFSEIHPDYYQIPVADRIALMEEEAAYARAQEEEDEKPKKRGRSRSRSKPRAETTVSDDGVATGDLAETELRPINGMDVVDLDDDNHGDNDSQSDEATSPMERVSESPVDSPSDDEDDHDDDDDDNDDDDDSESGDDRFRASERDDGIESIAEEDVSEEIKHVRKPRPRKYKIQEVIKVRQILLVQVVKEERGNKGAALTTYLSLAGRYCVLMPNTARGGGISRKITNVADRKKLKEIASEIEVPKGAGLIIRTAGSQRTKTEIKRDYEYLQRMWEQIRALTLQSIAPAKIYEEGDLIKRSIRDLYNRDIDEVFVEGAEGYRTAKDFMRMIMPSHAKNVKLYQDQMPLFARHQVESYLSGMFNPTVQLKSGGYIVIGVTEALVAIDVNSGRATKEGSIEQTALNTNLEAAEEVARQLRLRDLAGLIVIDFIDMEERKNNSAVEKRFKDRLKTDRARIQVGRISGFGLMEMSRQRLRPGMIEATTQPCLACHGTGLVRSDDNLALNILRQLEEEGVRKRSKEVLLKVPVGICNFLMNQKREHVANIETRYGMSVRIEVDPTLISPDFSIEKFKTATRVVEQVMPVVSVDASHMADDVEDDYEEAAEIEAEAEVEAEAQVEVKVAAPETPDATSSGDDEGQPKKRRRRRRRRKNGGSGNGDGADRNGDSDNGNSDNAENGNGDSDNGNGDADREKVAEPAETVASAQAEAVVDAPTEVRADSPVAAAPEAVPAPQVTEQVEPAASEAKADDAEKPAKAPRKRAPAKPRTRKTAAQKAAEAELAAEPAQTSEVAETPEAAPVAETVVPEAVDAPKRDVQPPAEPLELPEPVMAGAEPEPEDAQEDESAKPKRRGWWSLGR
ncbi:ribonuclease E/G [Oceaniovalibus sp. ACAM 378]|uniref:ribonuclease E/G n=1 Tax=Oceaniovalibus sp. ACAM 378 TaxID=2599923 RepID=UPI0011D8185C|nr:ribonuclease E/G [Oceaniovalibus sp. ACAM 378]TYB87751.1 Rne/Rng family ribonuclease [Oceaniovalibus sp. ACAM 378]